jgi:hypothetical protein
MRYARKVKEIGEWRVTAQREFQESVCLMSHWKGVLAALIYSPGPGRIQRDRFFQSCGCEPEGGINLVNLVCKEMKGHLMLAPMHIWAWLLSRSCAHVVVGCDVMLQCQL